MNPVEETIERVEEMNERLEQGGIKQEDLRLLKSYTAVTTVFAIVGVVLTTKAVVNKIKKEREIKRLKIHFAETQDK
jgi:hypothetical protein